MRYCESQPFHFKFPITALREVKMLQQLKHENITDLIEVCSSKGGPIGSMVVLSCFFNKALLASAHNRDRSTFYLVFAFCEHDLAGLLSNSKIKISLVHIKTMMKVCLYFSFQNHFGMKFC